MLNAIPLNYKMDDIINKFLLEGDKFMPEMHLIQPGLTYGACGTLTKHKQRIEKFMQTRDTNYIYKNELDNACFAHDGYERSLAAMVYSFFDRKTKGSGIKNEIKQNQQLAKELHKPIIRKSKKRKVYSAFKENFWGADLADMQLISKFNKELRFL